MYKGFTPANVVRTDPDGRYRIDGLGDGVYFVGKFDADRVPADEIAARRICPIRLA
jgi:hypothetical protein